MQTKIDAEVTIKFIIEDVCDLEDIDSDCDDFEAIVQDRIMDEGLYSLLEADASDDYEIVDIKKIH
jgi:hypothetical protein